MSGSQKQEERECADRVLLHIKEVASWNGCQDTHTDSLSDFRCALNSCHTLRKNTASCPYSFLSLEDIGS